MQRGASPHAALLEVGPVLALASRACAADVTQMLLSAGAEVDAKDCRGWTPLMHAVDAHSPNFSCAIPHGTHAFTPACTHT